MSSVFSVLASIPLVARRGNGPGGSGAGVVIAPRARAHGQT